MYSREFDWFKLRQEIHCGDSANHLMKVLSKTNIIEQFLLDVSQVLVTRRQEENNKVLDTLLFYFDTQIEDLESIAIMCRRGFFSSASAILRRVFLALGKMLTLIKRPSEVKKIRDGKQQTDREIVDVLEKLGVTRDKLIYPTLCWSTHLNFNWVPIAREASALGDISVKSYLLTEGILLTALRFAIQSASLLILFLDQTGAEALNSLKGQIDEYSSWWRQHYVDFRQRVDEAFDEHDPGAP
ncbi:MAG: hypothetical protein ACE5K8_00850 [Candidatus Zixiibacteriota bacterium]